MDVPLPSFPALTGKIHSILIQLGFFGDFPFIIETFFFLCLYLQSPLSFCWCLMDRSGKFIRFIVWFSRWLRRRQIVRQSFNCLNPSHLFWLTQRSAACCVQLASFPLHGGTRSLYRRQRLSSVKGPPCDHVTLHTFHSNNNSPPPLLLKTNKFDKSDQFDQFD